jgi:hypothetical protein
MAMLGEKLSGGPTDHSAGLGVVSGALFLGSSRVCPMLLVACERLPRTGTAHRKRTCHVGWVSPYRVYIDSNHRDSQI